MHVIVTVGTELNAKGKVTVTRVPALDVIVPLRIIDPSAIDESGQLFEGDTIVAESGIVLPNSSVITGATSQLYNDAGFVTYLGATNSASAASLTQLTASTITASSLSATLAYTSTLTVGTILNFSPGGSIGTNLFLTGTLTCPAATITSLVVTGSASVTQAFASSLSGNQLTYVTGSLNTAFASTLTVGTILNFSAGGSIGTNLFLTGTLTSPAATITSLVVTGNASVTNNATIGQNLTVSNILTATKDVQVGQNLTVAGVKVLPQVTADWDSIPGFHRYGSGHQKQTCPGRRCPCIPHTCIDSRYRNL